MSKNKSDSSNCSAESGDFVLGYSRANKKNKDGKIEITHHKKEIFGALKGLTGNQRDFIVSGQTTSTDMPVKSTAADLEKKNLGRGMLGIFPQARSLTMTSLQADFPAKVFPLLEGVRVFKTSQEELFSSKSAVSLEIKDHRTYSLRMLKDYFLTTGDAPSRSYSFRWMNLGTMSNGRCSTLSIGCHKTGKGSLSSVLEEKVDEKYYLGKIALNRLFNSNFQSQHNLADEISPTLQTPTGSGHIPKITQALRWQRTNKGKKARQESQKQGKDYTPFNEGHRELAPSKENVSGCITDAINKDSLVGNQQRIRRLTPKECERLQGFPDGWTKGVSDTQRYKCMGNAVSVPVIKAMGKSIIRFLS